MVGGASAYSTARINGDVYVGGGGKLGGFGKVDGNVTVAANGYLTPGAPGGVFTVGAPHAGAGQHRAVQPRRAGRRLRHARRRPQRVGPGRPDPERRAPGHLERRRLRPRSVPAVRLHRRADDNQWRNHLHRGRPDHPDAVRSQADQPDQHRGHAAGILERRRTGQPDPDGRRLRRLVGHQPGIGATSTAARPARAIPPTPSPSSAAPPAPSRSTTPPARCWPRACSSPATATA